jgi:hypothetical protein
MRIRLVTAGAGAAWEAALVQACQAGTVPAEILHRCYDLGDLLAVATAGQAEAAVVATSTRWLDHDALARLAAAGLAVVGVAPAGDEDSERRLRQLGLHHVGTDTDPPAALVDLTRAALTAEPTPDPSEPPDAPPPADHDTPHTWSPSGARKAPPAAPPSPSTSPSKPPRWSATSCWWTPTPTAARWRTPTCKNSIGPAHPAPARPPSCRMPGG